ncbi:phosphate transporter [Asanoa ishikariensis]|uniref:Phosphate transporter n=1 Tax=Asanoa ishikariensis TaxID=137265 RepID=A0A1H3R7T8_9ACTN|nr:inorganic phosphate transporter [Asanoa ishikariensis]GIF64362.1 phosphate transporter [Asanoa ishikariensis]SDZ21298.1 inorganic phosphate transporter, PiT family [Asanoa ishikariensis]
MDTLVIVVIITALAFDFTNGFHDTANAMATSIATKALRPRVAVAISAVLNLAGAFLSVQVAKTISSGLVDDAKITPAVIFGGLVGAILWNLLTWLVGLPSSSSHALFGGLIGATWIAAGGDAVNFATVVTKVIIPAIASPLIAGVVAATGTFLLYNITRRAAKGKVRAGFRHGQVVSASLVSLAHGANDAQKTMGVITLVLITAGVLGADSGPPLWVIFTSGLAIALGTYFGGWRIIRTVGHRLTKIEPQQGFAAETSAATVILASSNLGYPLSTTQVTSGAVIGSGVGKKLSEVKWGVAGRIAIAWGLTLPAAAAIGALAGRVAISGTAGVIIVAAVLVALAATFYLLSRRNKVDRHNVNDEPVASPKSKSKPSVASRYAR